MNKSKIIKAINEIKKETISSMGEEIKEFLWDKFIDRWDNKDLIYYEFNLWFSLWWSNEVRVERGGERLEWYRRYTKETNMNDWTFEKW